MRDALDRHADGEAAGIKAHFRMDESGLLTLDNVRRREEGGEGERDEEMEERGGRSSLVTSLSLSHFLPQVEFLFEFEKEEESTLSSEEN